MCHSACDVFVVGFAGGVPVEEAGPRCGTGPVWQVER